MLHLCRFLEFMHIVILNNFINFPETILLLEFPIRSECPQFCFLLHKDFITGFPIIIVMHMVIWPKQHMS